MDAIALATSEHDCSGEQTKSTGSDVYIKQQFEEHITEGNVLRQTRYCTSTFVGTSTAEGVEGVSDFINMSFAVLRTAPARALRLHRV